MRFWDSSAIVPLLVEEASTPGIMALWEQDPGMVVWWGTPVECVSALARREREGSLASGDLSRAIARLKALAAAWHEVLATEAVREAAQRILRVHPLRTADSLQLAAAVVAADGTPASLSFVCLDDRLSGAALREGFPVQPGS